jgi:hypothetical protein
MKTYTVKELHEILGKAVEDGKGDLIILVPNNDTDMDADYATLGSIDFDIDAYGKYAYFEQNLGAEEDLYWAEGEE